MSRRALQVCVWGALNSRSSFSHLNLCIFQRETFDVSKIHCRKKCISQSNSSIFFFQFIMKSFSSWVSVGVWKVGCINPSKVLSVGVHSWHTATAEQHVRLSTTKESLICLQQYVSTSYIDKNPYSCLNCTLVYTSVYTSIFLHLCHRHIFHLL